MKKVFRLLEWLNTNEIEFELQDLNDDEGNFLIQTNRYEIETTNYNHELEITTEHEDWDYHLHIYEFEKWYKTL